MNKFEQLIEFVINDEEAKARELFHDIVVEKSRAIYEEMMEEETVEESEEQIDEESTHAEDDKAEKAGRKVTKDIEYDDKKDKMDEGMDADDLKYWEDAMLSNPDILRSMADSTAARTSGTGQYDEVFTNERIDMSNLTSALNQIGKVVKDKNATK